jgi:hypothetical protein
VEAEGIDYRNPATKKNAGFCVSTDKLEKCQSGAKSKMKLKTKLFALYYEWLILCLLLVLLISFYPDTSSATGKRSWTPAAMDTSKNPLIRILLWQELKNIYP